MAPTATVTRDTAQPRSPTPKRWNPDQWRSSIRSTWHRNRKQARPHLIAGGVLAAGAAAHALGLAGVPYVTPAVTGASLVGPAAYYAVAGRSRIPARRRGHLATSWLATSAWLPWASTEFGWTTTAALAVGTVTLSARYWREHRDGYPTLAAVETPDTADDTADTVSSVLEMWKANIACPGGPVEGSTLTPLAVTGVTETYMIQLQPGKHTLRAVLANLDRIATGLRRHVRNIIIEEMPETEDDEGDPSQLLLTVVTRSPIKGKLILTEPNYRDGDIAIGPYADGAGDALYHLYTTDSMWSGVIIGGTGIGKSRVIESIAIGAMASGCTVVWFIDPQGGASSPALAEHADWFVDESGAPAMLAAAEQIVFARVRENRYEGWTGFTPSPQRPGLLIIIDECHRIFTPKVAQRWAGLAREARKVGVGLLAASQYPGLETFGGVDPLRSSIMEGNVIAMRTASNSAGQIMAGLQVNPATLAKIPGYGWYQDMQGGRSAPFRNRLAINPGQWMAAQPRVTLDTLSAAAAGDAYRRRHETAEVNRESLRLFVEALRSGAPLSVAADFAVAMLAAGGALSGQLLPPDTAPAADLDLPEAITVPDGLTDAERAVCDALADGAERPKDIAEATGYSERHVSNLLGALVDRGIVVKPAFGRYALAGNETKTNEMKED